MEFVHLNVFRRRNVTADGGIGSLEECGDLCALIQHPRNDSKKPFERAENLGSFTLHDFESSLTQASISKCSFD